MAKTGKGEQPKRAKAKSARSKSVKQVSKVAPATHKPLPGSFLLSREAFSVLARHWKPLGGIMLVYLLINTFFAGGFSNITNSISSLRDSADTSSSFSSLIGGDNSQASSILPSLLFVVESLVIIWALRHLLAGHSIKVKQAYYSSMAPFIPFLLVILVILIQLLPLTLGMGALGVVLSSVFSSDALVILITSLVFILLAGWSIYMLSSSIFALYIVTLPDMQPRQALRSAKTLVRGRRWSIIRRVLFLPLFMFLIMIALLTPLLILVPVASAVTLYLLGLLAVLFAHTYLYSLYRSML